MLTVENKSNDSVHLYRLAVQAGFNSDMVECLPSIHVRDTQFSPQQAQYKLVCFILNTKYCMINDHKSTISFAE